MAPNVAAGRTVAAALLVEAGGPCHRGWVSRWALRLALAASVAGCTRLNGAFEAEQAQTGGPSKDTDTTRTTGGVSGDPTRDDAGASTTAPGSGTEDPSTPDTLEGGSTAGEMCIKVLGPDGGCDLYGAQACDGGRCRPFGDGQSIVGVACVEQEPDLPQVSLGAACTHRCIDAIGADNCPGGSLCDPFSDDPHCVPLCNPDEDTVQCGQDSTCFSHDAGRDTFGICRPGCDPLALDCQDGETCLPSPVGFQCVPAGEADEGEGCAFVNDCAPGLACADAMGSGCSGSEGCCGQVCSIGVGDCPEDQVCQPIRFGVGVCVDD